MLSKVPTQYLESLTVRDLEDLLEMKKKSPQLGELMRDREHLRLELRRVEDQIQALENGDPSRSGYEASLGKSSHSLGSSGNGRGLLGRVGDGRPGEPGPQHSFLAGKRKKNLKDYIAQVLLEENGPMSPSNIQKRLPEVGYVSNSTNPRSFYNTVFQALQRYDIFEKEHKKYRLSDEALKTNGVREILPKKKTRLKDYIVEVLDKTDSPLKVSEIASRVVIAGYDTDLEMDELNQRVSATLKKYLNKDFDWDSQRYRLAHRG
jgi:hypothetical protein